MTRSASAASVIAAARQCERCYLSGGVRCDFDDEIGIECGRDALEQRNRRYHPSGSRRDKAGWVIAARRASSVWDRPSAWRRSRIAEPMRNAR